MRPVLDMGEPVAGLVVGWRQRPAHGASPAMWEALVASGDLEAFRFQWVPAMYLTPVEAPRESGDQTL